LPVIRLGTCLAYNDNLTVNIFPIHSLHSVLGVGGFAKRHKGEIWLGRLDLHDVPEVSEGALKVGLLHWLGAAA